MRLKKKGLGLALLALVSIFILPTSSASAAQITSRSLALQAGATDGGSLPSGNVKHFFTFTLPTNASIGSIQFQYCTTASGTCTLPTGLVTTAATLTAQTGATGFTMVNTTNGSPYITRTAAALGSTNVVTTYQLSSITNPGPTPQTFFVRITDFTSTNVSTGATDTGTVAASTTNAIILTGVMPESLIFCTGSLIAIANGVPNCSSTGTGSISFNQLFSPTDTAIANSQFAASTNASSGYNITVNGATMTSGSNTIAAMASAGSSVKGTAQFGMNLRLDTTASASSFATSGSGTTADLTPVSDGVNLKGQAAAGYNTVDTFKFASGDTVANSAYPATPGPTNGQVYTASYIVNVPGNQLAGSYTTTLTYICTPTF
jgi:hypothetical protein